MLTRSGTTCRILILPFHLRCHSTCVHETHGVAEKPSTCSAQALEQQSRRAAQRQAAERVSKRAEAFKKRKQHSTQMRKKTRSGQPVMKVRIGKMLEQLQDDAR